MYRYTIIKEFLIVCIISLAGNCRTSDGSEERNWGITGQ